MRRRILVLATAVIMLALSLTPAGAQGGPDLTIPQVWSARVYNTFYNEYVTHVYAQVCNDGDTALTPPSAYSDLVDVVLYDATGAAITAAMLTDELPAHTCQLADFDESDLITAHCAVYAAVDSGANYGYYTVDESDETNNASPMLYLCDWNLYLPVMLK